MLPLRDKQCHIDVHNRREHRLMKVELDLPALLSTVLLRTST